MEDGVDATQDVTVLSASSDLSSIEIVVGVDTGVATGNMLRLYGRLAILL